MASADDLAVVRLTVETDVAQFDYTLRALDAQAQILTEKRSRPTGSRSASSPPNSRAGS